MSFPQCYGLGLVGKPENMCIDNLTLTGSAAFDGPDPPFVLMLWQLIGAFGPKAWAVTISLSFLRTSVTMGWDKSTDAVLNADQLRATLDGVNTVVLPPSMRPGISIEIPVLVTDNATNTIGVMEVSTGGSITIKPAPTGGNFTVGFTGGIQAGSVTWPVA